MLALDDSSLHGHAFAVNALVYAPIRVVVCE